MSELRVGRPVVIKVGKHVGVVGMIVDYDEELDIYLVNTTLFSQSGHTADELKPLYTLDQVTDIVVEKATTPLLEQRVAEFGMSSEELAAYCAEYIVACISRIKGVGNDQYSEGGHQKFEVMELEDLIDYLREELMDVGNYAAMLDIRMRRIKEALQEVDDLGQGTEEDFENTDYSVEDFESGD